MTALVSLNVASICHFRVKKTPQNLIFLRLFFKVKTELNYQSNLYFSHAFEIFIPSFIVSFGEVTAGVSLKVVTNGSFTSRKISESILRLLF